MTFRRETIAAVIIGRNEGERLRRSLASLQGLLTGVYVDSGSDDGSQALARELGFEVVDLDVSGGFTAAKARNAGLARLLERTPNLEFVQMIDGDCEIAPEWPAAALAALGERDDLAVVFGRRQEREPQRNLYHQAIDQEWAVPPGEVNSCGGDALFRVAALRQVGGYDPKLIAGEEPELCLRLRQQGWHIRCIDQKMTLHDVDMTGFGQWWRRSKRAGYAFSRLVGLYGAAADPHWRRLTRSALFWTAAMAGSAALALFGVLAAVRPAAVLGLIGLAGCVLQVLRTAWRHRSQFPGLGTAIGWSVLLFATKLAQTSGWWRYKLDHWRARQGELIEYK